MGTTYTPYEPIITETIDHKVKLNQVDWKESVVVRSPNWLGDAIMTLPALYQLRKLMSDKATFDIVCPNKMESFWRCVPWVDNVISFSGRRVNKEKRDRLIAPLGAGAAIVLPNSFGSAKDLYLKSIPVRIGRRGNMRRALLTHTLPSFIRKKGHDAHHQASEYFDIISAFGRIERSTDYPPLQVGALFSNSLAVQVQLELEESEKDRPVLLIAPGAAFGPAKQWPVRHFAAVAEKWSNEGGVVLIIGTDDDVLSGETILFNCTHGFNLAGQTDLREVIAVMQMSDVCVCNDSGGMHLAAASGLSGVAVFGSTSPIATGPISPSKWIIAQTDLKCSPCLERECPLEKGEEQYRCLNDIDPDSVFNQLMSLLEDN